MHRKVSLHPASPVYVAAKAQKASVFKPTRSFGTCTARMKRSCRRSNLATGDIWDCPVGATLWAPLNQLQHRRTVSVQHRQRRRRHARRLLIRHPRPIDRWRPAASSTTTPPRAPSRPARRSRDDRRRRRSRRGDQLREHQGGRHDHGDGDRGGKVAAGTPVLVRHTGVAATAAGRVGGRVRLLSRCLMAGAPRLRNPRRCRRSNRPNRWPNQNRRARARTRARASSNR
jgi:hypothetical protein